MDSGMHVVDYASSIRLEINETVEKKWGKTKSKHKALLPSDWSTLWSRGLVGDIGTGSSVIPNFYARRRAKGIE